MSRPATGTVEIKNARRRHAAFQLRFSVHGRREHEALHERRSCLCGCGGAWNERTAAVELENCSLASAPASGASATLRRPSRASRSDLPRVRVRLAAVEDRRCPRRPADRHEHRDRLPLAPRQHLLPFFGEYRLDEIDADLCVAFKAHKLQEAAELRRAIAAGAVLRDRRGRRVRPLGPALIRKLTDCLAAILDEAVEDGHIDRNPARGRRMRVKVPKPSRTFLEMDELVALTDAASEQDAARASDARTRAAARPPRRRSPSAGPPACGPAISPPSSASQGDRQLPPPPPGRGGAGDLHRAPRDRRDPRRLRRARQRALRHAHPRPPAARGDRRALPDPRRQDRGRHPRGPGQPGPRRRARRPSRPAPARGLPTDPDAHLFPNLRGGRMSRQRARDRPRGSRAGLDAPGHPRSAGASEHDAPHAAPHLHLDRAAGEPLRRPLGHEPGRPRRLEDDDGRLRPAAAARRPRARRAFDALVRRARERLYGTAARPDAPGLVDPTPTAHDV